DALRGEPFDLADDVVDGPRALLAADRWDRGEAAGPIAAFGDLHVGAVPPLREPPWIGRAHAPLGRVPDHEPLAASTEDLAELQHVARAEGGVELRHLRGEVGR